MLADGFRKSFGVRKGSMIAPPSFTLPNKHSTFVSISPCDNSLERNTREENRRKKKFRVNAAAIVTTGRRRRSPIGIDDSKFRTSGLHV